MPIDTMQKSRDITKGDVLIFQGFDQKYKAILCTTTMKIGSPFLFEFAALTIDMEMKPDLDDIRSAHFFGKGNRYDDFFEYAEAEKRKMWKLHPEIHPYCLGSYGLLISRKDLMKARDHFDLIGNLNIVDHLDKHSGSGMNASDLDFLRDFFTDKYKTILPDRGLIAFRVEAIVRE
jgi:hypothetical protein